jgi:hypothetical protein
MNRIRAEALALGVHSHRIVFHSVSDRDVLFYRWGTARSQGLTRTSHPLLCVALCRYNRVHLYVDTPVFNSHSTAIDALYHGVPIVTVVSRAFQVRQEVAVVTVAMLARSLAVLSPFSVVHCCAYARACASLWQGRVAASVLRAARCGALVTHSMLVRVVVHASQRCGT